MREGLAVGLPEIVAGLMLLALNAYALTGGADFGGGVWDLLARGATRDRQRAHIAESIAPIWEANHVWLIVVVVVFFTAFPAAFATVSVVLHIPLSLMLVGIVLRGSAFVFRSYGSAAVGPQHRWDLVFSIASTTTPVLLGITVGAIASGAVGVAGRVTEGALPAGASFAALYVRPWASPFPIAVGILALALFAYLAAIYLAVAARDDAMREHFRRCALAAAGVVFVAAAGALGLAFFTAAGVGGALMGGVWTIALQVAIGISAVIAIVALWRKRLLVARAAAAIQVSLILWGWALVQYPYIVPGSITIHEAAAPTITLELLLWGLVGGTLILAPSLGYLFRVFSPVAPRAAR